MKMILTAATGIALALGCGADQDPEPSAVPAPAEQAPARAKPAPPASKRAPRLPAETMRGPYPTLAAYCARRAEEARTDGTRDFRCETAPPGANLAAGRCEEHGCCEHRAAATKSCPRFVIDKPLDNRADTARAQLVALWSGSHADCALAVQTGRGWYLTRRARSCRTVGVTLGWLEVYDLSWFDDVHIPSEWKREPLPGQAVASHCKPGDDKAPEFTAVHWRASIKLVGPLEVEIQTSGDTTGKLRVSPPPPGRHELPLGD